MLTFEERDLSRGDRRREDNNNKEEAAAALRKENGNPDSCRARPSAERQRTEIGSGFGHYKWRRGANV